MAGGGGQALQGLLPWTGGGQPMIPGPSALPSVTGGGSTYAGLPPGAMLPSSNPTAQPGQSMQDMFSGMGTARPQATQIPGAPRGPAVTPAMLQVLIKRMLGTS